MLVTGDRILAVVPYGEETPYVDARTRVLDFGERMMMPGFVDAHTHFFMGAVAQSRHVCSEPVHARSERECVEMMKRYAASHPEEKRLRGRGWLVTNWENEEMPTKRSLDEAFPDIPVYMQSEDAHCYWLNSKAIEECGITAAMETETGYVGKDMDGEPNGLLVEIEASRPADRMYHAFSEEEEYHVYRDFLRVVAENGITSLSEMTLAEYGETEKQRYRIIRKMERRGEMTARLHVFPKLPVKETSCAEAAALRREFDSTYFRISGLKGFIDGVLEAHTGLLLEPYTDLPQSRGVGVPTCSQQELNACVTEANREGFPVRLHCIADGSVRMALDAFEAAARECGRTGLPNAIEHMEIMDPADIPRFQELGVLPSMQPMHLLLGGSEIDRVGAARVKNEWLTKSLLHGSGGHLAIGTDCPVVALNPFDTIYAAVTRRYFDGSPASCNPEQALTMAETLRAYTYGAAEAYSRQDELGSLEPGKYADITVIDRDLFAVPADEIRSRRVEWTMVGGRIVFEREKER